MKVRNTARALILISLPVCACAPTDPLSTDCGSTAECALGDICLLPERSCVPEEQDTIVGSFSCTLVGEKQPFPDVGSTDVIANTGGARIPLNWEARCQVLDDEVLISLWYYATMDDPFYFVAAVPAEAVYSGQPFFIGEPGTLEGRLGGYLFTPDDQLIAIAANTLLATSPTQMGQRLRGYIRGGLLSGL